MCSIYCLLFEFCIRISLSCNIVQIKETCNVKNLSKLSIDINIDYNVDCRLWTLRCVDVLRVKMYVYDINIHDIMLSCLRTRNHEIISTMYIIYIYYNV